MTEEQREEARMKDRERKRLQRIDKKFKPHSLEVISGRKKQPMTGK